MADSTCYICGISIGGDAATVNIPRLALRLHLSCYQRDIGASRPATRPATHRESLAYRLGARAPKRKAS